MTSSWVWFLRGAVLIGVGLVIVENLGAAGPPSRTLLRRAWSSQRQATCAPGRPPLGRHCHRPARPVFPVFCHRFDHSVIRRKADMTTHTLAVEHQRKDSNEEYGLFSLRGSRVSPRWRRDIVTYDGEKSIPPYDVTRCRYVRNAGGPAGVACSVTKKSPAAYFRMVMWSCVCASPHATRSDAPRSATEQRLWRRVRTQLRRAICD